MLELNVQYINGAYQTLCAINKDELLITDKGRIIHKPLSDIKFLWDPEPPDTEAYKKFIPLGLAARDLEERETINYLLGKNTDDVIVSGEDTVWSWAVG